MKRVPIYHVRTWRKSAADRHRITYRPGLMTLARRLLWTFAIAALALPIEAAHNRYMERQTAAALSTVADDQRAELEELGGAAREMLRQTVSEEEYNEIMEKIEADEIALGVEIRQNKARNHAVVTYSRNGALVFLALVALLPPLSCLWNRITLERDAYGNFIVRYWRLLPGKRAWLIDTFSHIDIYVYERIAHTRYWGFQSHGWWWIVQLAIKGSRQGPVMMDAALSSEAYGPQFFVHRQKDRPTADAPLPPQVQKFIEALNFLTALTHGKPSIIETESTTAYGRKHMIKRKMTKALPGLHETKTYASIDEVPPELQERFQELSAQAKDNPSGQVFSSTTRRITIQNADGTTKTYNSLKEMPPELRKIYQQHNKS